MLAQAIQHNYFNLEIYKIYFTNQLIANHSAGEAFFMPSRFSSRFIPKLGDEILLFSESYDMSIVAYQGSFVITKLPQSELQIFHITKQVNEKKILGNATRDG